MQYKSFMEALKGKQHKIDKNKNGKIDSHDFKLLRKEETEDTNESFDFNRAAMAKQRLMNLKGKKVRGANIANLMRAAGLKEEELEESELDQLDEVLSADAKAGDWIHDFVHSTNPKFEGKSKKERIQMALGAYYAKKRSKDGEGVNEETQQVDEGLGSVISSAFQKMKAKLTPSTKPSTPPVTPVKVKAGGPKPGTPEQRAAVQRTAIQRAAVQRAKIKAGVPKTAASSAPKQWTPSAADRKAMQDKLAKQRPNNDASVKASIAGRKAEREAGLRESVKTTHEDPLVTVHDKDGLHTHANLSTANAIFNTNVGHKEVHKGPVKTKDGHETKRDLTFALSKHHENAMKESKDYEYADGDMSITQLKQIKAHSEWILDMLKPNTDMPEWVQSKITLAADYLSTACDYLHVELNEAALKKVGQPVDVDKVHAAGQEPHEEKFETVKKKTVKEEYDEEGNVTYSKVSFSQFMETLNEMKTELKMRPNGGADVMHPSSNKPIASITPKMDKFGGKHRATFWGHASGADQTKEFDSHEDAHKWVRNRHAASTVGTRALAKAVRKEETESVSEAMTATQVRPGVTRYTGGSYGSAKGAKYGNTDYDNEDIDKKEDESQEQPKRGRGRPAGAKSGARGPRIK